MMEEIKIYISIKRLLLVFLATAAFLAALFGLRYHLLSDCQALNLSTSTSSKAVHLLVSTIRMIHGKAIKKM